MLRSPAPFARLHGTSGSDWAWSRMPSLLHAFAVEAELTDDHLEALLLWLGLGTLGVVIAGAAGGLAQALILIFLVVAVPGAVAWRWSGRRTLGVVDSLPDLVDTVGRSLRSGASLVQSLGEAAVESPPVLARELELMLSAMGRGQPAALVLRSWADRVPRAEVRIVAAALAVASRNEAGTSQALAGVSQSLRDRSSLRAEIRSQTAQAAASMQALVVLPAVFLGFDAMGSGHTVTFLTTEPLGRGCLVLAVLLDIAGGVWISSMVRRRSPT